MIILHGRGDSAYGLAGIPPHFKMDDEMNYLLLDAPYDYYGGRSWYDLPPNQLEGIEYSSKILTEICDELFAKQFDISQSFLFGFSQGSLLVFEFGARYHQAFAGYFAISGYIYDAKKLLKEINSKVKESKWLCTHGRQDDVLPFIDSMNQVETLQDGGLDVEFRPFNKRHNLIMNELELIAEYMKL